MDCCLGLASYGTCIQASRYARSECKQWGKARGLCCLMKARYSMPEMGYTSLLAQVPLRMVVVTLVLSLLLLLLPLLTPLAFEAFTSIDTIGYQV